MNNFFMPFLISFLSGLSTTLGCLLIFIKPKKIDRLLSITLSFSATIMILISIFDLIPLSFYNLVLNYKFIGIIISIISFLIGIIFVNIFDRITNSKKKKGSSLYKLGIISMISLILHNIPEGIITFLTSSNNINLGIKMGLIIALHNIPEGIIISIPIYYSTKSFSRALIYTLISGLSELFGALLCYIFLYKYITYNILNIISISVAGIMIYLSINNIYKESFKYNKSIKYFILGLIIGLVIFISSIVI